VAGRLTLETPPAKASGEADGPTSNWFDSWHGRSGEVETMTAIFLRARRASKVIIPAPAKRSS
jgi:hypothetical protein